MIEIKKFFKGRVGIEEIHYYQTHSSESQDQGGSTLQRPLDEHT